jgi:hypothetical protein
VAYYKFQKCSRRKPILCKIIYYTVIAELRCKYLTLSLIGEVSTRFPGVSWTELAWLTRDTREVWRVHVGIKAASQNYASTARSVFGNVA